MNIIRLPGLIDMHVHLRDPGQTQKEDFFTGTSAALAGGFTTIIDMPNNATPITSYERLQEKIREAKNKTVCNIGFYFGSLGENIDEFKKIKEYAFGLKLYLNPTTGNYLIDSSILDTVYTHWDSNQPILVHAEADVIGQVIEAVRKYRKPAHVCHVSSQLELQAIIDAKEQGLSITCGVCPHHLFLTEKDTSVLGPYAMMKPALKSEKDVAFLWDNLKYIDVIESDHAPHTRAEKRSKTPPFGVPGLETTLPLLLTAYTEKKLTLEDIVRLCHEGPIKILNLARDKDTWIEVDLDEKYEIKNKDLKTKSGWSPFKGRVVNGKVVRVFIRGEKVFENGTVLAKAGSGKIMRPLKQPQRLAPYYDFSKSYDYNYIYGPFGDFAKDQQYKQQGKPTNGFMGQQVYLPFGIPAGPLVNGAFCKAALDRGFDLVTYKTVRSGKYASHKWPNVLHVKTEGSITFEQAEKGIRADHHIEDPLSITNSFGVPSYDPDIWQKDIQNIIEYCKPGQTVIGSFQGTIQNDHSVQSYIEDFARTARLMKETGVKIMEANLSCPNEGSHNLLCFDIQRVTDVITAIKREIGNTPLIVKIAYFQDDNHLKRLIDAVGNMVNAFSAINTIPAKIIDEEGNQKLPGEGRLWSGVCGHAIKWAGLDMIRRLDRIRDQYGYSYRLIGVGGVIEPKDYIEYKKAGADAVMSATGSMWNPYLAQEIKSLIKRNGKS